MKRPKMDDYKIKVLHFNTFEEAVSGKYVTDLEKYCDYLEQRTESDEWNLTCIDKDCSKLEKALDKACAMLATQGTCTDCWEFNECPFRNACNEKHNGGCNDSQKWKAWCMEDE